MPLPQIIIKTFYHNKVNYAHSNGTFSSNFPPFCPTHCCCCCCVAAAVVVFVVAVAHIVAVAHATAVVVAAWSPRTQVAR